MAGKTAAQAVSRNQSRRAGSGRGAVDSDGRGQLPGALWPAPAGRPGEPLAAGGASKRFLLADSGGQKPSDREHEGVYRPENRHPCGCPPGGVHDCGPGYPAAGRGRRCPGGGGNRGGKLLRRCHRSHAFLCPGRRPSGLRLQGSQYHGFHAGLCGDAL